MLHQCFSTPSFCQDFRVKIGGKRIRPNPEPVDITGVSRFVLIISYGHTTATLALQNGVDVKTVSNMLGHFRAGFTLDTYAHVTTQAQKEAANTMGSLLKGK